MAIVMCEGECKRGYGPCDSPTTSYDGMVLSVYERNGYHDSDFYAIVLDDGKVKSVPYATTAGWTYHNSARVDASPEVRAEAEEVFAQTLAGLIREQDAAELATPAKGDLVESTTTRGRNVGLRGLVGWVGLGRTRDRWSQPSLRLGIRVAEQEKMTFIDANRVKVVETSRQAMSEQECLDMARNRSKGTNFRLY